MNGSVTDKGNYMWAGALTLAWNELKSKIIKEDIKVKSESPIIEEIVNNFNHSAFKKKDLSEDCCYVKAGYGNATIHKINEEVKKKFPEKTTPALEANLSDVDIIAFGYFFKKLKFEYPFEKINEIYFNNKTVNGFRAATKNQKKQILVHKYKDPDNFIVSLQTKSANERIYMLKLEEKYSAEEIVEKVNKIQSNGVPLI